MIAALAMVAGTAKAQNENEVYGGGTYTYNLTGIKTSAAGGNINIVYGGDTEEILMTSATESGSEPTWEIDASAGGYTATFTIEFSTVAVQATNNLVVTITDLDVNSPCSNFINYEITVYPPPTYTLDIVAVIAGYEECQSAGTDPIEDNEANKLGTDISDEVNTFTFTVAPTITGIIPGTDYTYNYKISSTDLAGTLNSFNIASGPSTAELVYASETVSRTTDVNPSTLPTDVFTVTFNTTTGLAALDIEAILSNIAGDAVLSVIGGVTENASFTNASASVTVGAVPSIGKFE